jgi:hypothetical protein
VECFLSSLESRDGNYLVLCCGLWKRKRKRDSVVRKMRCNIDFRTVGGYSDEWG